MKEFQKIKETGSSMLSEAHSSDKQEFGSFYLSRLLDDTYIVFSYSIGISMFHFFALLIASS